MKTKQNEGISTGLEGLLKAMKNAPVLVIGDLMLDRFVYGGVERISPESPVPVLKIHRESAMPGGAGNALANLQGLGAKGAILSVTGADENGAALLTRMKKTGLAVEGIIAAPDRPTTVKTRYLAGHQQLLRTDFEDAKPIDAALEKRLLEKAAEMIPAVGAIILSDYGKGLLTLSLIKNIIALAGKNGVPVIVDPKGSDYKKYKGAAAVTPNKKELSEAAGGMPVGTDEEVIEAAQKVIKESGVESVIATRSKDGISVITRKDQPVHFHGRDIEVFDVSGAGDTVIATVAAALAAGAGLAMAAQLANIAGGIVVTKAGTAPIRIEELIDACAEGQNGRRARHRYAPLASWDEAYEQVQRWKMRGLKVGFTNGCFDVLHAGHVSYLNDARDHCDRLIVGLNNDASVKILKGEDRPVHDETSRAAVLGALGAVDLVVLFGAKEKTGDNTANEIIAKLQPDIYFKGGDYTEDQIPEAPGVKKYGGIVKVMPVVAGQSSTGSINKIRAA